MSTSPQAAAPAAEETRRRLAEMLQRRAAAPRTYPASFTQRRVWFLDAMQPGNPAFNVSLALLLTGPLDAAALERALAEVVRRHGALRTRFAAPDGEPVQVVETAVALPLGAEDHRGMDDAAQHAHSQAAMAALQAEPFDLARAPLLRARLLRYADEQHLLALVAHHAVADGWSLKIVQEELMALYGAFAAGRPSPLPEVPLHFGDFAVWQREWLRGATLERQLAFWTAQLADAPALLEIPTDRPRPAVQTSAAASAEFRVGRGAAARFRALLRGEGATGFMGLLAALATVLGRWAGQEVVVVGSPVLGRGRPELEGTVGFFANTLALRVDLRGDPSFRELVRRVRADLLAAFAHPDLPFDRVVEAVGAERRLDHDPVYQVLFTHHQVGAEGTMLREVAPVVAGVRWEVTSAGATATSSDLVLHAQEGDDELLANLEWRSDLFDRATAERLARHLDALLAEVAADPDRPLSALSLLSPDERVRVTAEWPAGPAAEAFTAPAHALFERRARENPGAAALVLGAESVSYGELNARANRLARRLRALGVGADVVVAVSLERSVELVVATLAVLKAGGAYLPVDPRYPAERRAYLLADAAAPLVLTQAALVGELPAFAGRAIVLDDPAERGRVDAGDGAELDLAVDVEQLAYVIYTSGSTGRPKGVMVPHRGLPALAAAQAAAFGVGPGSRVLQFASASFDAAVSELVVTLAAGATLVLAAQDEVMPGPPLARTLHDQAVTALTLPPSALAVLEGEAFPALRTVVSAGEACPPELVRRWRAAGCRFVNAYGPTETTVCASMAADEDGGRRPGIGRPLPGGRMYVLDAGLRPVPPGVPGEICVGGIGLARGYRGRPGMTAERFAPDPFSSVPGARLYRTGDRGRWRPDGTAEFLGRADDQLKVRGFRVEPGEVESVLREAPGVRDAVVVAVGGTLAAYVVAAEAGFDAAALRGRCRDRLPEHMVPATVTRLDALPRTPGGKLDRAALPAPDVAAAAGHERPRTATEEIVAGVWAAVLGVEAPGREAGFFELGGHSLLATQVAARVRTALGVEMPLRLLFERPVLRELAARLDELARADALPPVVPVSRDCPLPLSFAQERLWFVDRMAPGMPAYNLPFFLPLPPDGDEAVLARALSALVARHEALRTVFGEHDGAPVQTVTAPYEVALERMDAADEAGVRARIAEAVNRPFDLSHGPLLRAHLVHGPAGRLLVLAMHHIVSDGWSMGVLVRELRALYDAFAAGRPSPLAPLRVQYADFAAWQRATLEAGELARQTAYWRERLRGAPRLMQLPTDRPRPAIATGRGAGEVCGLPRRLSAQLRALARAEGTTLYMVLLAGFQLLLSRWTGQTDVVTGVPVAGRGREELDGLVGFFVNNLVARGDLSGDPSFRALVRQARERLLEAYAHQDVPFERLVDELGTERSLSHTPLFQVVLNLQNTPGLEAAHAEAVVGEDGEEEPAHALDAGFVQAVKYDLAIHLGETDAGLAGSVEYSTDLFDAATIRRLLRHFRALLRAAVDAPDLPVSRLATPGDEEREAVRGWNRATRRDYPTVGEGRIHDLFTAQAARTPDALALVWGPVELSYAALDAASNRLARRLQRLGVGPDVPVALCMERSAAMVVALLAVLKAGGAYVPVDPVYPVERVAFMLADTGAPVVLADAHTAVSLPAHGGVTVRVDAEWDEIEREDASPVRSAASPENLAYVIYTSGSTGRPKGVAVEHRSTVTLLHWLRETVSDEERRSVLGSTSISFDVAVGSIYGTLCWGGTLVLVENALALAGVKREVTYASMVPSAAAELLRMGAFPPSLRTLMLGGEPLPLALAQGIHAATGVQRLGNCYGPTEDTTYSTVGFIERGAERIHVGRPVANTQAYVLDRHLHPVPVGVPGELYLAGEGVTRGYFRRPGLTAERYLPDPFDEDGGGRMYRVGDRVRWLPDGTLECLGRVDGQVKVRGFRIETGEVEAALASHPGVRDAVVVARDSAAAGTRLVAYVVASAGGEVDPAALRGHLRARLPEYMLPAALVEIDALPMTPNGKVDRLALPAPVFDGDAAREFVAPRTPTEEAVAALWCEVLGVARVGATDHFFELGGHSLLATQLVSRLRSALGVELPLRAAFEAPVVAELAARVDAARGGAERPRAARIGVASRAGRQMRLDGDGALHGV